MKSLSFLYAAAALLLLSGAASAQNYTCPTRAPNDNSNACASTAYVDRSFGPSAIFNAISGAISCTSSGVCSINTGAVSNSALAPMPAQTIKGNATAGSATPQDLTPAQVRAIIGAGTNNYTAPGSGAVTRTIQAKLQDVSVSPSDYGACVNSNDSAAFQAMLNALAGAGGGSIRIPAGMSCQLHGLTWSSGNSLRIWGDGPSSLFLLDSTSQPLFSATAGTVEFDDLRVAYPTPNSVSNNVNFFAFTNTFGYLHRITFYNGGNLASWGCGSGGGAEWIYSQGVSNNGFVVDVSCNSSGQQYGGLQFSNILMQAAATNAGSGFGFISGDTMFMQNVNVAGFQWNINASTSSSHSYLDNLVLTNVFADGAGGPAATVAAIYLNGSSNFLGHISLTNVSANAMGFSPTGGGRGIYALNVYNLRMTNVQALANCQAGITIDAGTKDVIMTGLTVSGNSTCAANVSDGIDILSNANNVILTSSKVGATRAYTGTGVVNSQKYNVFVANNVTNYIIQNNDLSGAQSTTLQDAGAGTSGTTKFVGNNILGAYVP